MTDIPVSDSSLLISAAAAEPAPPRPSIGGVLIVILGAYILATGIWVIGMGGPWGNAATGLAMVGGGAVNARGERLGGWVHAVVGVGTLVWALV